MDKIIAYRVNELIEKLKKKDKEVLAVYGAGAHTDYLLEQLFSAGINIKYLVDFGEDKIDMIYRGEFIIHDIKDVINNVDTIIISSFSFQQQIYERIKYVEKYGIEILKIYKDIDYIIANNPNLKDYTEADIKALKAKTKNSSMKINIGGGNWFKPGWKNVDWYVNEVFVDYRINLLENQHIPVENASVQKLFCSHLIEHISDENAQKLFDEIYRILQANGMARICCPDADKAFEAYRNNNRDFFYLDEVRLVGDSVEKRLVNFFASYEREDYKGGPIIEDNIIKDKFYSMGKDEYIKWCCNQIPSDAKYRAHINGFYFGKLQRMLRQSGFKKVTLSSFMNSSDEELREPMFDNRPNQSLYVECHKE